MRYYFHWLYGTERVFDETGSDYPNATTARNAAIAAGRELLGDRLRGGLPLDGDAYVEIVDQAGQLLDVVSLISAAFGGASITRHRRLFEAVDQNYLLLTPDLTILEANRAYLSATLTHLSAIARKPLFSVFPDNPGDPEANGVRNLSASLETVLREKTKHVMAVQRYDIRRPDGTWERRDWKPTNTPVLDDNGEVAFIVHHAEDVTLRLFRR